MTIAQIMFTAFVGLTLLITFYAAKKNTGASAYFAAGRSITGWQNGLAVAGDYMSAASFLGISGMICFYGYDGFMYSVGFLVAYITVLLIVAEPLRNAGKYTMADLLAYRLKPRPVRALASLSTLTVSTIYMIAQMVGAGGIIERLIKIEFAPAVIGVGVLMLVYVVFGGMLATTWVQIVKALLLMAGALLLSYMVLKHHHFSFAEFFSSVAKADYGGSESVPKNLMQPGLKYGVAAAGPWGPLDLISLCLGLVLGTAGLPHILVRFYTVPDAKTARSSVVWAMAIIGLFYIMTTFFGFGAATILKKELITIGTKPDTNMVAPILANHMGGEFFFAFISAVAFATILAVVAGLTMSASASFAHDFYSNVIHHGKENRPGEEVKVARITAFCVGAVSIGIAIFLGPSVNTAFLVGLAFAVAASANLPVIIFSVFWKRFNTTGAVAGLSIGLLSSIILILLSPNGIFGKDGAIFPLENPGIVSIPIGFLAAYLGTIFTARDLEAEAKFAELTVRAHTGLGAEKATSH
ncbi:cation acetate symporter [Prosthecobacter sp.]|uniref:cation acetate symporter n=1 Tax=Prosthecobacter sp. TaxID=1965333 RepID=UPI003783AA6E